MPPWDDMDFPRLPASLVGTRTLSARPCAFVAFVGSADPTRLVCRIVGRAGACARLSQTPPTPPASRGEPSGSSAVALESHRCPARGLTCGRSLPSVSLARLDGDENCYPNATRASRALMAGMEMPPHGEGGEPVGGGGGERAPLEEPGTDT
jgi:hypothetical protein